MKKWLIDVEFRRTLVIPADDFGDMIEKVKSHLSNRKVIDCSDPQDEKFDDGYEPRIDVFHAKEIE